MLKNQLLFTAFFIGLFQMGVFQSLLCSAHAGLKNNPANDDPCITYLHGQLYKRPTRIRWVKDWCDHYAPSNQGRLNTCWMSAGEHILNPTLTQAGLLKPNEGLSHDYYSGLVIAASIRRDFREDFPVEAYNIGAFFLSDTPQFILEEGVVKNHQFSFPKHWVKTKTGNRYKTDIRYSKALQESFFRKINAAIDAEDQFQLEKVMRHYMGKIDLVKPLNVPASVRNQLNLRVYSTQKDYVKKYNLNSAFTISTEVIHPDEVEIITKLSLDQKHPVLIGVPDLDHFKRMTQFSKYKSQVTPTLDKDGAHHAVTIIGYGFDQNQNAWYKLINNRGYRWGHNGAVAVSAEFLRTQQIGFIAPLK
jgi:hypothetical protein